MKTINTGFLGLLRSRVTTLELERRYQEAAACRSLLRQAERAVLKPEQMLPDALKLLDLEIRKILGIRPE